MEGEALRKLARLQGLRPWLMDATLRENSVGSKLGLTVADKMEILRLSRGFGFKRILLGALNGSMHEELSVEEDFLAALRDQGIDRSGGFALVDLGRCGPEGFEPSLSLSRWEELGVPCAMLEASWSDHERSEPFDLAQFERDAKASVAWIRQRRPGAEIALNVVDAFDAFESHRSRWEGAMLALGRLDIEAVSLEEGRGVFLPFQVGAAVALAREALPSKIGLLAHAHAGAGYENAAMMEALACGADGAWGGLIKGAGLIGHASLGELLANLKRLGNPWVDEYEMERLAPLCDRLSMLIEGGPAPETAPIFGAHANRLTMEFFRQRADRPWDLPPESIGAAQGWRVCPAASGPGAVLGRLREVAGEEAGSWEIALEMARLMRQDLRQGLRVAYDEPAEMEKLARRARPPSGGQ